MRYTQIVHLSYHAFTLIIPHPRSLLGPRVCCTSVHHPPGATALLHATHLELQGSARALSRASALRDCSCTDKPWQAWKQHHSATTDSVCMDHRMCAWIGAQSVARACEP